VLRRSDSLARLGEATFASLLLDTDSRAGRQLAERLRAELHRVPLRLPTAAVYVSASIGLAQWRPGESSESLMQRADAALVMAKANGGNRIELAA
jgi:diguanylate cyclase (GGDEF)-like protein